jgi:transcriptional regulator with XRE-family HTH domain
VARTSLSDAQRARGRALGAVLREARGKRTMAEVATAAGISPETLRKIELGRIPTPAFFTVVALAAVLGMPLDALVVSVERLTSVAFRAPEG